MNAPAIDRKTEIWLVAREARASSRSVAEVAAEVHLDLLRDIMAEPAGPVRRRIRGLGTGLPYRPQNGLPEEDYS